MNDEIKNLIKEEVKKEVEEKNKGNKKLISLLIICCISSLFFSIKVYSDIVTFKVDQYNSTQLENPSNPVLNKEAESKSEDVNSQSVENKGKNEEKKEINKDKYTKINIIINKDNIINDLKVNIEGKIIQINKKDKYNELIITSTKDNETLFYGVIDKLKEVEYKEGDEISVYGYLNDTVNNYPVVSELIEQK